jgi:hypothetical protein
LAEINDHEVATYLKHFKFMPRQSFFDKYPHSDPALVEVLESLLRFRPSDRRNCFELLGSELFEEYAYDAYNCLPD